MRFRIILNELLTYYHAANGMSIGKLKQNGIAGVISVNLYRLRGDIVG